MLDVDCRETNIALAVLFVPRRAVEDIVSGNGAAPGQARTVRRRSRDAVIVVIRSRQDQLIRADVVTVPRKDLEVVEPEAFLVTLVPEGTEVFPVDAESAVAPATSGAEDPAVGPRAGVVIELEIQ